MRKIFNFITVICAGACAAAVIGTAVCADTFAECPTSVIAAVTPEGQYENWDGTSNFSQFIDSAGNFSFACDGKDEVTVVRLNSEDQVLKKRISLKKLHPLFGAVTCDRKGNYYLVTGEENNSKSSAKDTIFITKYDKNGKILGTVGDNGSSSLNSSSNSSFYTKKPFESGNCALAVNGNLLTCNYGRRMYSGHQSNSVIIINTDSMKKLNAAPVYNSHSFAQRVISFGSGFVYASEGDCFPRAFTVNTYSDKQMSDGKDIFHFWVEKGAFDKYDMSIVNDNFSHMGGLAPLNDKYVAFIGTSAKITQF